MKLKDNSETAFANRPYNNHARYSMVTIERGPAAVAAGEKKKLHGNHYLPAGPIIASMVPAATAVPITPATLGPWHYRGNSYHVQAITCMN